MPPHPSGSNTPPDAGAPADGGKAPDEALRELASILYWHLKRYELEDDSREWAELSEQEQAMHVKCVAAVLKEDRLIAATAV